MDLSFTAPSPTYRDRFCSAWRGEESLAWVFWSYYVLIGLGMTAVLVALLPIMHSLSGGDLRDFPTTPVGGAFLFIVDVVQLIYVAIAFVLAVRCISNVSAKGWQYLALIWLLGVSSQTVEQAREVVSAVFGA